MIFVVFFSMMNPARVQDLDGFELYMCDSLNGQGGTC